MEIIYDGMPFVNNILRNRKFLSGEYHPSQFLHIQQETDIYLVFHTLTRGLILLTKEELEFLQENIEVNNELEISAVVAFLIHRGFLVQTSVDEEDVYFQVFQILQGFNRNDGISGYTILPTTACNARCFYCFEKEFEFVNMTPQTAHAVAEYIAAHSNGKKVLINWFGGEPLCNPNAINVICDDLKRMDVQYESVMVTNGLLLTDTIIIHAKECWNLRNVQITLDGCKDEHNRRKNYRYTNVDPFEQTVKNIKDLIKHKVNVCVRINFDIKNIDDVPRLIDFITTEIGANEHLVVYPAMLFESCGTWIPNNNADDNQLLFDHTIVFRNLLTEKQLFRPAKLKKVLKTNRCPADNRNHLIINPQGRFMVCHNQSDTENYGSVFNGITNPTLYNKWKIPTGIPNKCAGCAWLPECTPFSMCPTVTSFCKQNKHDMASRSLSLAYKRWKK